MRRISFITSFLMMSAAVFAQTYNLSVTKSNGQTVVIPTEDISKIEFVEEGAPYLEVMPQVRQVPYIGGKVAFEIVSNCDWTYKVDKAGVSEVSKTDDKLVLNFPRYVSVEASVYKITFDYEGKQAVVTLTQESAPKADLLDIVFKEDGTAEDVSPLKHAVITKDAPTLMTYYSDMHKRHVANFRHAHGSSVTTGYYRVNYKANDDFISRVADGCTFESIIMLGDTDPSNAEVKWFSSMQAGGIGFILPTHDRSKCITFLPNVSTTGSSNWRWTHSQVQPEVGKYYHVVGVWNKEEGKTYIYINGQLSGTASAPGNYVPVAAGAESFIIGGDPESNQTTCASAWNGDIVTARIYDEPMTADQIAGLWQAAAFDESAKAFTITDLQYMSTCEVGSGYKYSIYGKGFEQGDVIELQKTDGSATFQPETTVSADAVKIVIPANMTSGVYKIIVKRGDVKMPLCAAGFTVSANPLEPIVPKVIAHRGAHTDGATENSIAALKKAMDANYYGIELDVWRTTDDRLVVHHDGVMSGLTFSNCSYDRIKDLKLANGEVLPTLDNFIATFKEKMNTSTSKLIIEIKPCNDNRIIDLVMAMVEEAGIKDRVEYIAFSYNNCKYIVSKQSDAKVGYLNGDLSPETVKSAGICSVDYSMGAYDNHPEWIKEARRLGMIVNVWTVNSANDMLRFIAQGAHYITTDAPALLEELAAKNFIEP